LRRQRTWTKLSLVMRVNIHEAKTHLSRLVEKAVAGEEVIIGKAGKPMVRLVPYKEVEQPQRTPGGWEGKAWISPDFDKPDKEIEKLFYGEDD